MLADSSQLRQHKRNILQLRACDGAVVIGDDLPYDFFLDILQLDYALFDATLGDELDDFDVLGLADPVRAI